MFIQLESILDNLERYRAHIKSNEEKAVCKTETLEEHTKLCQKYCERLICEKGLKAIFEHFCNVYLGELDLESKELFWSMLINVITFHDVGKINPNFQRLAMKNADVALDPEYFVAERMHSCISAVLYIDYFRQKIKESSPKNIREKLECFLLFNSYIISRHHSGLIPFEEYLERLKQGRESDIIEKFEEDKDVYKPDFKLKLSIIKRISMNTCILMEKQSRKQSLWLYIYTKLLYSLLVASDYYATSEFTTGIEIQSLGNLDNIQDFISAYKNAEIPVAIRKYEKEYYPKETKNLLKSENINDLRSEMFLDTEREFLKNAEKNIFYLEGPTGSGKSNMAMNLSFQMIEKDMKLKKIFYVYPFNTLVEQNKNNLYKVFGNNEKLWKDIAVVNSITPIKRVEHERSKEEKEESTGYYEKALLDRQFLNYPMVVTTHVSIFDTFFGDTKESVFAFCQMPGSVLVLDEIQSYKVEIWGKIVSFLKEMADMLHMKIIIMSATLPNLHYLADNTTGMATLILNRKKYFMHPCFRNRVKVNYELLEKNYDEEILYNHIMKNAIGTRKILVEFICKNTASAFYQRVSKDKSGNMKVFYMSGDDSLYERSKILDYIKENAVSPVILIATQVVEAGVDIDMDIGYKNISMFDSEEQFVGRINRSFFREGTAYFFKADKAKNIYGQDPRLNVEFTIENEEMQKIFMNKNFPEYYEKIMKVIKNNFDEVNSERGLENFMHNKVGQLDYREVKKVMQLIDENEWSMSVYLARCIEDLQGNIIDGGEVWDSYCALLKNNTLSYPEKKVRLSDITSKMSNFIYQIKKNPDLIYDEQIGDIFYIRNGEKYFDNDKLNRKKIQGEIGEFIDFI